MKFYAHIDTRPTCISLHEFIEKGWLEIVDTTEASDVIIVWWWDGFMLNTMRRFHWLWKPFLWLNCGTLWFLLNSFNEDVSWDFFTQENLEETTVSPVQVILHMKDWLTKEWFFFNDCVVWWSVLDYVSFSVEHSSKTIDAKWTGLVINSMLWSTWYALNLGQPLIPVSSDLRWVVGIASAPFQYGFLEPERTIIKRSSRNDIVVGLDGYNGKYEGVEYIEILPSDQKNTLMFFKDHPFEEKRLLLAEEKLGR